MKKIIQRLIKKQTLPDFESILLANRINLFRQKNITTILDVGANSGQYAESVLKHFNCNIISFEPMIPEYKIIMSKIPGYKNWIAFNYGLGDENKNETINISKNSFSSSILKLNGITTTFDESIGYIDKQDISIKRLDSIWNILPNLTGNILLKIDTQGYESKVLDGCSAVLDKITGIQIELSIIELYENEPLFDVMYNKIKQLGFELYIIEPGYKDPKSGKLLQIEAVFFKD